MFKNWMSLFLGIIIISMSFADLSSFTLMWTLSVVGAVMAFNSLWSLLFEQEAENEYKNT